MDFSADHFALFELPRVFRLDTAALDKRYREVLAAVHPDKFSGADDSQRRLSLQWSTRINEAYQSLKKPLSRACYLLELAGVDIALKNNTAMPTDFLVEQMEWREAVSEASVARDGHTLEELFLRVRQRIDESVEELSALLDDAHDFTKAADRVRRLMFLEKLLFDIDEAIAALDE